MSLIVDSDSSSFDAEPPIYTPTKLKNRFEKLSYAGSGGEGVIYEVKEKSTDHRLALKIANNNWSITDDNKLVAKTVSIILKEGISPHLTRIHELLTVKCLVFAKFAEYTAKEFFKPKCEEDDNRKFPRRATLMEILEGNLEKIRNEFTASTSLIALKIQLASILNILKQQGVRSPEATKFKNILYKTLEPKDVFNDKAMIDFDFWKYVFGNHELYLPRPKYLIKLGDYDSWTVNPSDSQVDPVKNLEAYLSTENLTIEKVKDLFKKPEDPNAKILEVYNSSKTKP